MMRESCLLTRTGQTNGFEKRGICPKSAYPHFGGIKTEFEAHCIKYGCVCNAKRQLRECVAGAGSYHEHVEHLLRSYRLGRCQFVEHGLARDFVQPRGVLLCGAEACVEGICVVGHYRSYLAAERYKLLELLKYLGERTERTADRKSHAQSRKFIYIAHKIILSTGCLLLVALLRGV